MKWSRQGVFDKLEKSLANSGLCRNPSYTCILGIFLTNDIPYTHLVCTATFYLDGFFNIDLLGFVH